jgi:DNA-binding NarL/FixJ family response regulator
MDLQLPGISGQQCIEIVKSKNPTMQFIVFTVFGDDDNVFRALRSGATGYLVKSENYQNIWDAIQLVACGGSPMTPSISRMVIAYFSTLKSNETVQKLTKRECEILELLAQGKRYKEIAEELFISMDTVRTHIRNIYIKLEVDNKTSAINKYKS